MEGHGGEEDVLRQALCSDLERVDMIAVIAGEE